MFDQKGSLATFLLIGLVAVIILVVGIYFFSRTTIRHTIMIGTPAPLQSALPSVLPSPTFPVTVTPPPLPINPAYKTVSGDTTSPDKKYTVSSTLVGDGNYIVLKDSTGKIISSDLVSDNQDEIGYGTKIGCQCGTTFLGWTASNQLVLQTVTGDGQEFEVLINDDSGKAVKNSLIRIK